MATLQLIYNYLLVLSLFMLFAITAGAGSNEVTQNWLNHGGDLCNRRYARDETKISPKTVSKLTLKWEFYAGQDITATPAIYDDTLYFPSWNGFIYAVKASDGSLVWKKNLEALTGLTGTGLVVGANWTVSRSTPTVIRDHDVLIGGIYGPSVVIAVERSTGKLIWSTQLDSHAAGAITMSGTYHKGLVHAKSIIQLVFYQVHQKYIS